MTSPILEEMADTRLEHPEEVRDESECPFDFCGEYGNILRCYMDMKFRERCVYFIRLIKKSGVEE